MRRFPRFALPRTALALAVLAGAPAAANAAAPQYLTEARCLGVYEAGYFIFSKIAEMGPAAGAGVLIADAVNGAAKMSYEQTIEGVIARDDMNDTELAAFRDMHLSSSDAMRQSYATGDLDLFGAGQMVYDCDVQLGYADD